MIASLEELKFEGSYPTAETIKKAYDQLDLQRSAQAYLDFMPANSSLTSACDASWLTASGWATVWPE